LRVPRANAIVRRSRQYGRAAQWKNGLARALRDAMARWMPDSLLRAQLRALVDPVHGQIAEEPAR
jgi:hypothetical protein